MSFLGALADQIASQYSVGENTTNTLDAVVDGQNVKYGSLGDFAKKFDQSAERRYLEEGYIRKDPFNVDVKQLEILMQEPSATILVKKRMFSSLADNFRPDFMDKDEKLYYKATKILFQNKCRQISALERLSKIAKITSITGNVNDQLMPLIFTLTEDAGLAQFVSNEIPGDFSAFGQINSNADASQFVRTIDRVRRLYGFNRTFNTTEWITDNTDLFASQFGEGTGVIELTNFTSLNTTTTLNILNPGTFSIGITDPYEAMIVTEFDIEKAIADATNGFKNNKVFQQLGQEGADQVINDLSSRLSQFRNDRGASPISFKINPDTLLGKRVTAVIDRLGIELPFTYDSVSALTAGIAGNGVQVSDEYLKGGDVAGFDGLDNQKKKFNFINSVNVHNSSESELSIFQQLVSTIFSKLTLEANSKNALQLQNQNTNYARRKMRFTFAGKPILQPMDAVHIYINSKSKYDNHVLGGLQSFFKGSTALQAFGSALTDIVGQIDTIFAPAGNIDMQIEKSLFVGPEFPNFLWAIMRDQFVTEKEGTHVFAGLIDTATESYSGGKFTVDIRGTDNSAYLRKGKVNFKPAVDAFNGAIYDPLTPFKTTFDTISSNLSDQRPQLLLENEILLGNKNDINNPLVKFKSGPNAGRVATGDNYIQDISVDPVTKQFTRAFFAPDGLVYKWKEGIGTFVQFGSSLDINDAGRVGIPSLTQEPFAGQDVMNVVSLLITGHPYNFETYWKAVNNIDGFGKDPYSRQGAANSFFDALRNDLIKNNTLWGNFIPFKNLLIDEQTYVKALNTLFSIQNTNAQIETKLRELNNLENQALGYSLATSVQNSSVVNNLNTLKTNLYTEIQGLLDKIKQQDKTYFQHVGNDISFDSDYFQESTSSPSAKTLSDPKSRRDIRRKTNYLTRRMSYNVRANEDKNLFIVDDFYDKDIDIASFTQDLAQSFELYKNEFLDVASKIKTAVEPLNLEVFCDTQGHIRVRPPQYNRMPSSVFYRMMYLKKSLNIQVFPKFLDDLFSTQLRTLQERIEILEDEIRLDCAVLGNNDDTSAQLFIISSSDDALAGNGTSFGFVSTSDGIIGDIQNILKQANPDQNAVVPGGAFDLISTQASSHLNIFTTANRFEVIKKAIDPLFGQPGPNDFNIFNTVNFDQNLRINTLLQRLEQKTGKKPSKDNFFISSSDPIPTYGVVAPHAIDIFKVTNDLSEKLSERQKVLKLFYNAIKNAVEYRSLDDDKDNTANELLVPGTYGHSDIPEVFEHMIEDESYDDYGPGSGKRYIIKNSQIIQYTLEQHPPPFTAIEVHGVLNQFSSHGLPQGLNSFPDSGNGLVTALAIDYDTWRNYGLSEQHSINVPFLSEPESQCAPYAASVLSRARADILRANLTIAGNEFMQPGEVVFLESRGLLFYVESVSHAFVQGQGFSTQLSLTYGHTPGEYIPTTLDVVGKALYHNKDIATYRIQRQNSSFNESNIGILISDPNNLNGLFGDLLKSMTDSADQEVSGSTFGPANASTINNILYQASYSIRNNFIQNNNVKTTIELRIYYDGSSGGSPDSDLQEFANKAKNIMIGKSTMDTSKTDIKTNVELPPESVQVIPIDLSDEKLFNSPSQKAWDSVRNLIESNKVTISTGTSDSNTDDSNTPNKIKKDREKLKSTLFGYIVDCWIKKDITAPGQ